MSNKVTNLLATAFRLEHPPTHHNPNAAQTTEQTPLLAASSENPLTQADSETLDINKIGSTAATEEEQQADVEDEDEDKPLPIGQIILLCYARLVEPIAFFSIFPFINQMILEVGGVKEEDVGFYSGLIESLFSLTQMIFMISWGRASDRYGRKPVLVYSVIGVSIMTCLFGFSKSVWQMILFRCMAGVFSGTIVTVRTMLSENSTLKTQARAFSLFAFAGNVGIFLGPVIGGALSTPARQYPRVFGGIWFFEKYPYALPNIVASLFGFSAAVISSIYLKETLASQKDNGNKPTEPPMSTWKLLHQPGVAFTLFLWCFVSLQGLANTAVVPVFWFTSIPLGGYGFSPIQISLFLGLGGISQALWLLFVFPPSQRRWGTGGVLRYCSYIFPVGCIANPILQYLVRKHIITHSWILGVLPCVMVLSSSASMAFTCIQLAINNISPSPAVLGTMNALALAMVAGIRAVAPGLFASLFATGVKGQILGGYLVWVVMVGMTVILFVAVRFLPEKAEGRIKRVDGEGEA
ncbi:MFS general substrate transporter [Aureobasidium pullulans]|uniref:MFS general substrate transporter n=2 Tax=Aureobasidium pullulans TaxID=5580 RepID=A0A4S9VS69_AURPU|nr:MFS general substrate transporter [Aureobasidium pullulans]THZ41268.1 MFS general substrate transporter [Aureobasidium pullulans]THZ55234.1 MFS general substrate transporter [Aureobasidium pullulans]THZ55450.1 MFS general substrate transporter [Aureobasidium pullulans]